MDSPLHLLGDLAALSSFLYLLNTFRALLHASLSPGNMPHSHLFLCTTFHSRFHPVRHMFQYPVMYVGVDLDELDTARVNPRWWFGVNSRWAMLGIKDQDYLGQPVEGGKGSIKEKLMYQLETHNIPRTTITSLTRSILITTPRILGYAFNPVSYYFCYDAADHLRVVLLEVNNTFGEKHLYALDCDDMKRKQVSSSDAGIDAKERAGYNTTHILPRTFHVSPFNDRTGTYTIYTVDPFASPIPHLDVRIVIRNNPDLTLPREFSVSGTPTKKFMAKAQGDAIPLTPRNVLVTAARFTGNIFATVPRIMWQAGVLHYSKGLRVYPRPEPKVEWGTVGVKKPDGFESNAQKIVTAYLAHLIALDGTLALTIHLPDPLLSPILITPPTPTISTTTIDLYLVSYAFFANFLLYPRPLQALVNGYAEGTWRCKDETQLERVIGLILDAPVEKVEEGVEMGKRREERIVEWARRNFLSAVMGGAEGDKEWVWARLVGYVEDRRGVEGEVKATSTPTSCLNPLLQLLPIPHHASLLPPLLPASTHTTILPQNPIDAFVHAHPTLTLPPSAYALTLRSGALSVLVERALFALLATFASGRNPFEIEKRVWRGVRKVLAQGERRGVGIGRWIAVNERAVEGDAWEVARREEQEEGEEEDPFETEETERVKVVMECLRAAALKA